jgi:FolB domain-containing protein
MDTIYIRDLLARCVIGIGEDERREKQDIIINIILRADLSKACLTDRFEDTVDYRAVKKKVFAMVESSSFYLIEALAQRIAEICMEPAGVTSVTVQVDKPSALRFARSVGVEIRRERA